MVQNERPSRTDVAKAASVLADGVSSGMIGASS